MSYIPNTDADRQEMLKKIGVQSVEELFSAIPSELRLKRALKIPQMSEMEILAHIKELSHASLYDGATAAAEAVILAVRVTNRNRVVISETVSPLYRQVIATYLN